MGRPRRNTKVFPLNQDDSQRRRHSSASSDPGTSPTKSNRLGNELNIKNVKVLTKSSEYKLWRKHMLLILRFNQLDYVIKVAPSQNGDNWHNTIVLGMLHRTISDKIMSKLIHSEFAHDIKKNLLYWWILHLHQWKSVPLQD